MPSAPFGAIGTTVVPNVLLRRSLNLASAGRLSGVHIIAFHDAYCWSVSTILSKVWINSHAPTAIIKPKNTYLKVACALAMWAGFAAEVKYRIPAQANMAAAKGIAKPKMVLIIRCPSEAKWHTWQLSPSQGKSP